MTDLSNMINYKKPLKKKGGRPPTFSDPDKQRIFKEIKDGRANHDPECYRILQTHIMNDSTISEVQMDIDRAFEHVKGILKRANRRSKEPVKKVKPEEEIDEEQDEDTESIEEVTSVGDDPLTSSKDSDTLDKKIKAELDEVDLIIENTEKKKLKLTDEEHWEILKEYGIMHLLNDYLRKYVYYSPDEEVVSQDDFDDIPNDPLWDYNVALLNLYNDLLPKVNTVFYDELDMKIFKYVKAQLNKLERVWKKRKVRVKSTQSHVRSKDKMIFVNKDGKDVTIGVYDPEKEHLETEENIKNLEETKKKDYNKIFDEWFLATYGEPWTEEIRNKQIALEKGYEGTYDARTGMFIPKRIKSPQQE